MRTKNLEIRVAETVADLVNDENLCYFYNGTMASGQIEDMSCYKPIFGQYVKATMIATDYFNFHLIEIFTAETVWLFFKNIENTFFS